MVINAAMETERIIMSHFPPVTLEEVQRRTKGKRRLKKAVTLIMFILVVVLIILTNL